MSLLVTRYVCPHFMDEKSLLYIVVGKGRTLPERGPRAVSPDPRARTSILTLFA